MKNVSFIAGACIVAGMFIAAIAAPLLAPFDPYTVDLYQGLASPDTSHIFGQDRLGRDIFSRMIYGSRVSVTVGFLTVFISATAGTIVGSIAGYLGGKTDEILMRFADMILAFPGILLAIALMGVLGPGLDNVIIALCIAGWVGYARLVRGQFMTLREREYVRAAESAGAGPLRIIFRHILPNALAPIIVEATFGIATAITAEAGLSFLGLGVQPPTPSWGSMLNEGRAYMLLAPHMTFFPGIAIMMAVMGLNFLGDGLRDRLDPKRLKNT